MIALRAAAGMTCVVGLAGCGGDRVRCAIFPPGDPWNQDVGGLPVHAQSATWLASMGEGPLTAGERIPVRIVRGGDPVDVRFASPENSDPGPYVIPADAPISTPDGRVVVLDDETCRIYELYGARHDTGWTASHGSVFDLRGGPRREGWVHGRARLDPVHDASGLPVYPGLLRYDELAAGIHHALRVNSARSQRAFVAPATHAGSPSDDPALPPMGARLRLKASVDCHAEPLCTALQTYGLLIAHNGPTWSLSLEEDPRWGPIPAVSSRDLEFVETGPITAYGTNP